MHAGDEVECGGFAGAVWANQSLDVAGINLKTNVAGRADTAKVFVQIAGF